MTRNYSLLAVFVGVLACASWFVHVPVESAEETEEIERLERLRRASLDFQEQSRRWVYELETGSRSLRAVAEEVQTYCEVFYPKFLDSLERFEEGAQLERIARNLIRYFDADFLPRADAQRLAAVGRRLDRELATWAR